jgi:hypothetical protein
LWILLHPSCGCVFDTLIAQKHLLKRCKTWVQWLGRQMIVTLFSTEAWSSQGRRQWTLWPSFVFEEMLCEPLHE